MPAQHAGSTPQVPPQPCVCQCSILLHQVKQLEPRQGHGPQLWQANSQIDVLVWHSNCAWIRVDKALVIKLRPVQRIPQGTDAGENLLHGLVGGWDGVVQNGEQQKPLQNQGKISLAVLPYCNPGHATFKGCTDQDHAGAIRAIRGQVLYCRADDCLCRGRKAATDWRRSRAWR